MRLARVRRVESLKGIARMRGVVMGVFGYLLWLNRHITYSGRRWISGVIGLAGMKYVPRIGNFRVVDGPRSKKRRTR